MTLKMRQRQQQQFVKLPKKSRHFFMKLPDNFQMREHSWPCRFHIRFYNNKILHLLRCLHAVFPAKLFSIVELNCRFIVSWQYLKCISQYRYIQ
jgi:hypothetical protein